MAQTLVAPAARWLDRRWLGGESFPFMRRAGEPPAVQPTSRRRYEYLAD